MRGQTNTSIVIMRKIILLVISTLFLGLAVKAQNVEDYEIPLTKEELIKEWNSRVCDDIEGIYVRKRFIHSVDSFYNENSEEDHTGFIFYITKYNDSFYLLGTFDRSYFGIIQRKFGNKYTLKTSLKYYTGKRKELTIPCKFSPEVGFLELEPYIVKEYDGDYFRVMDFRDLYIDDMDSFRKTTSKPKSVTSHSIENTQYSLNETGKIGLSSYNLGYNILAGINACRIYNLVLKDKIGLFSETYFQLDFDGDNNANLGTLIGPSYTKILGKKTAYTMGLLLGLNMDFVILNRAEDPQKYGTQRSDSEFKLVYGFSSLYRLNTLDSGSINIGASWDNIRGFGISCGISENF